jgi:DNA polymerase elongation subunit (family B)
MKTRQLSGWLFDVDELGSEVVLWVYAKSGRLFRLTHEFFPSVYVEGNHQVLGMLAWEVQRRGFIDRLKWTKRKDFWTGKARAVLELQICDSGLLPRLRKLAASRRDLTFYNIDLPTPQYYLYTHNLFPLCNLEAEVDEYGRVLEIQVTDSPCEIKVELPRLRTLQMWGIEAMPLTSQSRIILACGGEDIQIKPDDGAKAIHAFNEFIQRHDPDLILSKRGDSLLFPILFKIANQKKLRVYADRDEVIARRTIITEGRTITSYGRVFYKSPDYPLRGRWHVDTKNSFFHQQTGVDGILELARIAKVPVQRMARQSPGTAMTSIELDLAVREGILINWHKSEPEQYKTALELLTIDKGGLTFQPKIGAFEDVAEIDFASMYPTIMVRHNLSPETVLCSCCDNQLVPEAKYNVCQKRQGLMAKALEPLIERRRLYKQRMRDCKDENLIEIFDARQSAIKWMLVSCFGYLGYKNARFGRVEAHESVTAFGREKLLKAKEMVETKGFRMLHALTDSLWIQKAGATRQDLLQLCQEISQETTVEMSLEGVYRWIVFPPSKQNESRPVATRYYGRFDDGRLKIRGLACRRSDTPLFIKEVQFEILQILKGAKTLKERINLQGMIDRVVEQRIRQLESGLVEPHKLTLKRTLTRDVDSYKAETRTAQAAKQMRDAGIPIHAGENVKYLFSDARSPAKNQKRQVKAYPLNSKTAYDVQAYIELLRDAIKELQ